MTNVTVSQFSDHPAEPIDSPKGGYSGKWSLEDLVDDALIGRAISCIERIEL